VATVVQALLFAYGQSRPLPVRQAWLFSEDDLLPVSEPGAKILNRIGGKALTTFLYIADPVALIMGAYAIVEEGRRRENVIFAQFIAENPAAAAEFAEWENQRRAGKQRRARSAETGDDGGGNEQPAGYAGNGFAETTGSPDVTL